MRKLMIIAALALLVPGLALAAGGKPAKPGKSQTAGSNAAPQVMYVLRGTLTAYAAANGATNGSVALAVTSSNHHGASLKGHTYAFAVSAKTKIAGTVTATHKGVVKLRGPKSGLGDPSGYASLVAFQVVDQGAAG